MLEIPHKVFSKSQWRALFAKANRGEIPMSKVKEMAEGVNYSKLPGHVGSGAHSDREMARRAGKSRRGRAGRK